MKRNNYLIDEYPLFVLPSLAAKVGLNEAIIMQQLHYWIGKSSHKIEGRKWVYNTYDAWQKQFPFWSVSTIRRVFLKLEEVGYIKTANYNKLKIDKTKWYSIDYEKFDYSNNNIEQAKSQLFIPERPLPLLPTLACVAGLQEAIILQELHYHQTSGDNTIFREGTVWCKTSYAQLHNTITYITKRQLKRIITSLVKQNVIIKEQFDKKRGDQTNYYSISYQKLHDMLQEQRQGMSHHS